MVTALHRKLLRDLARIWPQLLAVTLVMAVGIGALTMSLSTLHSLRRAQETYYERYRFPDVFAHLKRAPRRLEERISEIDGVARVRTRVVVDVNLDVPGLAEPATGRLVSIPDSPPYGLSELHLRRGRLPESGRGGEVLASETFVEAHGFELGQVIRAVINGRRQDLTIVGVALSPEYIYQIRPGDLFPDDRRFGVFWMPYRELAPAFNMDGAFNDVVITLVPGASEPLVLERLDDLTERYGGTGAYGRRDQTSHQYIDDEMTQLSGMAVIPPSIFLAASAFILNIVFSRLVHTQREQAAALRAFGYSTGQIAVHYLQMVVIVALMGGVLGTVLGWRMGGYLTELYTRFFRFPVFEFSVYRPAAGLALAVSVVAAVVGTAHAIQRAASLPPAQAMRPEAPPDYRETLIERLRVQRVFSPTGRMVLRHLERQPVRAAMTSFGAALSLAVLVMGGYTHGALEYLMDFQFQRTQRQDVTVTLTEPASPGAIDEVARLPGVLMAETFRSAPARLRAGHLSRREAVMGLQSGPELSRVLDERGVAAPIPRDGLLLSDTLAELLRVGPGDEVIVEVLEGQRPTLAVRVSGVVPTYLGTGAYIEKGALNRLMDEGDVISGAFLRVDPARARGLYATLKEAPRVAGVTVKAATLETFQKTFAENILIMRLFNLIFAGTIAVGVVYNSARIALAERAHELATLRILGFTRREVLGVLLGELGVLTLIAIPLGLVLGRLLTLYAAAALKTDTHRIPAIINTGTYAFGVVVLVSATVLASLVVRRGVNRLDLVGVLKSKG